MLLFAYLAIPVQFYFGGDALVRHVHRVHPGVDLPVLPGADGAQRRDRRAIIRAVGTVSWGLMMTVFTSQHMAILLVSGDAANPIAGGRRALVLPGLLTQFNDVAQYTWGKLFGRHKITPTVSPKKTWEGFLGGVATTTLVRP